MAVQSICFSIGSFTLAVASSSLQVQPGPATGVLPCIQYSQVRRSCQVELDGQPPLLSTS